MKSYDTGPFLRSSPSEDTLLPTRPPKALPFDRVTTEGLLETRALHRNIVGVVDFRNRTSAGRSKAGVPLYLFHPVDPGYPPFIVGSRVKPEENWFCTAEFVSWDAGHEWPRGAIQERLGPVGDGLTERKAVVLAAGAGAPGVPEPAVEAGHAVDFAGYRDEPWDAVFHVDPVGCEDVDDVLAYRDEPDGSRTWLIGIADVAAWVPEGSPLDAAALQRAQTLYDDGAAIVPMLPHILSTRLASLRSDGVRRPIVGLRVACPPGAAAAVVGELGLYQIAVGKTYSYESVVGTEDGRRVAALSAALGVASDDSHAWIETVMVAYNTHVAARLKACGHGLLRRLPASEAPPYKELAATTGCADLAHLGSQAGEYCAASVDGDVSHSGLGVAVYCHASSPLRRYADLVNQRVLHSLLRGIPLPAPVSPAHLNHRAAVLRRAERDLWFLDHILGGDWISETEGILLEGGESCRVYCPAWKRVLRAKAPESEGPVGARGLVRLFVDRARPQMARRTVCSFASATAPATDAATDAAADPI